MSQGLRKQSARDPEWAKVANVDLEFDWKAIEEADAIVEAELRAAGWRDHWLIRQEVHRRVKREDYCLTGEEVAGR